MTLKITRFFKDAIDKQAKISHFTGKINFNTPQKISSSWREKLNSQFGELFLNDANYIVTCAVQVQAPELGDDEEGDIEPEVTVSDKDIKKFAELLTTVFGTEVPKSDVKQVNDLLLVKITTK